MSEIGPDMEGFKAAQEELRQHFGEVICFFFPEEPTYPDGTALNPETGRPYDPQIEPSEEGGKDPVRLEHVNVAFRPVRGMAEDTVESPIGDVKMNECVLIMSLDQWAEVEGADAFTAKGDRYKLKKSTPDGIGSNYRQLVWGEREGSA